MTNLVLRGNRTSTPLAGDATYTGPWEDVSSYPGIVVAALSDVTGTLYVDYSTDASNVDVTLTYNVAASTPEQHRLVNLRQYMRVRYVNDSSPQTEFRLEILAGSFAPLSAPLNGVIARDADAAIVRSYPDFLEVATSKFSGVQVNNKSGRNGDIDTATVPEFIWEAGGLYTGFPTTSGELIEVVSTNANDTAGGTGAQEITVSGLDANGLVQSDTFATNGTSAGVSNLVFTRVHSAFVSAAGAGGVNAGTLTVRHNTTTANVFLTIVIGRNQSNAAVFTVPAGKRGIITRIQIEVDRANVSSVAGFLWTRAPGGAPVRYRRPWSASSSSIHSEKPYGGLVFPALTDLGLLVSSCSANNTAVYGSFDIVTVEDD